ncbi:hypothetical protein R6Z07F_003564 [Ovis aries]
MNPLGEGLLAASRSGKGEAHGSAQTLTQGGHNLYFRSSDPSPAPSPHRVCVPLPGVLGGTAGPGPKKSGMAPGYRGESQGCVRSSGQTAAAAPGAAPEARSRAEPRPDARGRAPGARGARPGGPPRAALTHRPAFVVRAAHKGAGGRASAARRPRAPMAGPAPPRPAPPPPRGHAARARRPAPGAARPPARPPLRSPLNPCAPGAPSRARSPPRPRGWHPARPQSPPGPTGPRSLTARRVASPAQAAREGSRAHSCCSSFQESAPGSPPRVRMPGLAPDEKADLRWPPASLSRRGAS